MAWPCYRLWLEGKASLAELDTLSIDDVETANDALDAWEDALTRMRKKADK